MAGQVPDFIRKGSYVLSHGKPRKVLDFGFTSNVDSPGIPNSDSLWLKLYGDKEAKLYEKLAIELITTGKRPGFLEIGQSVCKRGETKPVKVENLFYLPVTYRESRSPTVKSLQVKIEGYTSRKYEEGLFREAPLAAATQA